MDKFCDILKNLRQERNISLDDESIYIGEDVEMIDMWECGEGYPKPLQLLKLAKLYDIKVKDMVNNEYRIKFCKELKAVQMQYRKFSRQKTRLMYINSFVFLLALISYFFIGIFFQIWKVSMLVFAVAFIITVSINAYHKYKIYKYKKSKN